MLRFSVLRVPFSHPVLTHKSVTSQTTPNRCDNIWQTWFQTFPLKPFNKTWHEVLLRWREYKFDIQPHSSTRVKQRLRGSSKLKIRNQTPSSFGLFLGVFFLSEKIPECFSKVSEDPFHNCKSTLQNRRCVLNG